MSKETFERFVQYAYTGDYSIPKTEKRNVAVTPKLNGTHPQTADASVKSETTENGASAQPSSPVAQNGIRGRVNSLESDENPTSEVRDGSSEKLEDDGIILNYPTPNRKHKKKKSKAALEKAQKEGKDAELKAKNESVQEPEPQAQPAEPQPAEPEPAEPEQVQIQTESTPLAGQEDLPVQHILTTDFKSLSFPLLASRDNYEGTCEPSTEFAKDHSYSNVFLSHASLYILGDAQQVDKLKALALFKLHKTLCIFELDEENVGDITDLARYAYSGEDKELNEGIGGLRSLVCQYMAIHAKELAVDVRFMNLLARGGQIVKDFFQFQLQRIN